MDKQYESDYPSGHESGDLTEKIKELEQTIKLFKILNKNDPEIKLIQNYQGSSGKFSQYGINKIKSIIVDEFQ